MTKPTALITGASSGIGAAAARRFHAAGWNVIAIARRACPVEGVTSLTVDLGRADFEATLTERLAALLPDAPTRLCVIHNAAVLEKDTALTLSAAAMTKVLALNVVAPAAINRVLDRRLGAESSILYVGSTLSEKAVPNTASYVTSKHAVVGLMRATCQDLVGRPVWTACVCPGFTDTEMLRSHVGQNASILEQLGKASTMGRLVRPEEIADVLFFCATTPSINGTVLHANLGQIEH